MVRRVKELEKELNQESFGDVKPIDIHKNISPIALLKRGLLVMDNEISRLFERSEQKGLNGSEGMCLKEYINICSKVAKENRSLNIDPIDDEKLNTMTEQELAQSMFDAGKILGVDLEMLSRNNDRRSKEADEDKNHLF